MTELTPIGERIYNAALEFLAEEHALKTERELFRKLKYEHSKSESAPCFLPSLYGNTELCDLCKEYKARENYKGSLLKRRRAKRKMLTAYARLLK